MKFDAFTPQMLEFLMENHLRNSKPWYDAHKEQCRQLVTLPFYALTETMSPAMLEIDPQFVTEPYKVLSRVRRDTRFTKNKDLYRDHAWLTFRHSKQNLGSSLCYYFEIEQDSWGYGVGFYQIPSDVREEYRHMILYHDAAYLEANKALHKFPCFSLFGEQYKRMMFPQAAPEDQLWLNRKNIGVSFSSADFDTLFDGSFYDIMMDRLKGIAPFYHFLRTAENRVRHQ